MVTFVSIIFVFGVHLNQSMNVTFLRRFFLKKKKKKKNENKEKEKERLACVFLNLNSTLDSGYITESNFFFEIFKIEKKRLS